MRPITRWWAAFGLIASILAACQAPAASRTLQLQTLNGSGVTGTVTFTSLGATRTRVEVKADPAGHPDMPAHVHPGSCADLTPQPKYPLENVRAGTSTTDLRVSLDELLQGGTAVNLHSSNEDLKTYTACAEVG
jgi:hypothetical protein